MPPRAPRTPEERFETARGQLLATENGQEATMYGPLRDLFVEVLGYAAPNVDIDRSGARGHPRALPASPRRCFTRWVRTRGQSGPRRTLLRTRESSRPAMRAKGKPQRHGV